MDIDLHEALTQGFGAEPPHPPVADRLTEGHRAVRRRRTAGAVAVVAAAAVLGVGATMLTGADPAATPPVANDPGPPTTSAPSSTPAQPTPWKLAHYEDDGTLVIHPDAVVVDRVDNPLQLAAPDRSVALDLRYEGQESWALLKVEFDESGSLGAEGSFATPSADFADFADWVAVRASEAPSVASGDDYLPDVPVRFGEGTHLVPVDGVRIVLQRPRPDLPASFAPPGSRTAVALVEGPDGRREWVLARDVGGFDVVAFPASRASADVDEFLDFARKQYAGGEGLR